ncbi:Dissimilatory sulfite reductase (desulfoviridin), alpha and beta subunits [Acetitomaculum ruminis DSM 5522]|uniref:Dissimilatory sulfite reductase (Desulfoviridin), alpha and beta subunits n=1 Tax=Acetitomaculum ruminis DSM 5522 TaxID=1120918 RepID=A0A1I0Y2V1_9FIRM|nr:(4Fe-4S)-binding protein [Acetitomaculum ruminis]SFB07512.1 Dissimilatory sulfite reductase (desulfoviridin), alpha and beta subunits [Acetitomaculum ruminis DSM 5522]
MSEPKINNDEIKRLKGLGFLNNKGTNCFSARVITVNGKLTANKLEKISKAAEKFGNGNVTFTSRQCVEVLGIPYEKIEAFLEFIKEEGLYTGGTGAKVRPITSCKGTVCQYGLLDSFKISEEIHKRFYEGWHNVDLPHKFKIGIGGCPNNCMKPNLNDIGIVGAFIPEYISEDCRGCKKCNIEKVCPVSAPKLVDKKIEIDRTKCINCGLCREKCNFDIFTQGKYGYKVFVGGRWGKKTTIGKPLNVIYTKEEEVYSLIEKILDFYRKNGESKERLESVIERIGFEKFEESLGITKNLH